MTSKLRLGILGASNAQIYLPILQSLKAHFNPIAIYDPNPEAATQCQSTYNIPSTSITDILTNPEIDLILNLLPFESREQHTIAVLQSGKHVMLEVPLSMSIPSLRRIRDAIKKGKEANPPGPKVFVGCARRYAPAFKTFQNEIATLDRIYYARCRNIAGPMMPSVQPVIEPFAGMVQDVFGEDITLDRIAFCRFLGRLGCHDLVVMREALGFPDAVSGIAITDPFYSAIFHYTNEKDRYPFALLYEAGSDGVPRSDAHLTVYGAQKTVSIQYDFPRRGKLGAGGFVRVVVEEASGDVDEVDGEGIGPEVKRTETMSTCEEAYEGQLLAMHSYLVGEGNTDEDGVLDLRLLLLIFEHYNRQCGTISTPLG